MFPGASAEGPGLAETSVPRHRTPLRPLRGWRGARKLDYQAILSQVKRGDMVATDVEHRRGALGSLWSFYGELWSGIFDLSLIPMEIK